MAYKDKEKQREAARTRAQRFRERQGVMPKVTPNVTPSVTPNVTPRNAQRNALPVTPSVTPTDRMLQALLTDAEARITDLESRLTVLEARQPAYAPEPRIIAAPYRPVRGSGYQEQSYEDRNAMAGQMVRHTQTGKMVRVPMLDADGQPIPD